MNSSELFRFRVLGLFEGLSFLLLLGVGVPLKHLANNPMPVKILGSIHGGLFVLYVLSGLLCAFALKWDAKKTLRALAAAVFPFGPFILESKLKKEYGPLSRKEESEPELTL